MRADAVISRILVGGKEFLEQPEPSTNLRPLSMHPLCGNVLFDPATGNLCHQRAELPVGGIRLRIQRVDKRMFPGNHGETQSRRHRFSKTGDQS